MCRRFDKQKKTNCYALRMYDRDIAYAWIHAVAALFFFYCAGTYKGMQCFPGQYMLKIKCEKLNISSRKLT